MRRALCVTLLVAGFGMTAYADVTIKQSIEGKGLGMSGKTLSTMYIKGNKMDDRKH